jgi:hypothetical protein
MNRLVTRQAAKEDRPAGKRAMGQAAQQDQPASKPVTRRAMKYQRRLEKQRNFEGERKRVVQRKRKTIVSVVAAAVLLSAALGYFLYMHAAGSSVGSSPAPGPTSAVSEYSAVDGISCDSSAHTNFRMAVHLSMVINGQQVDIPNGIGAAPDYSCLYWLHTSINNSPTASTIRNIVKKIQKGVIYVEAPAERAFTLGNFLDIWSHRFSTMGYTSMLDQMGPGWQVYVNGKPYTGDFHTIPLTSHALITLAYNTTGVQPDTTFPWKMVPGA